MIEYQIQKLEEKIKNNSFPVVLYGAGVTGRMALYALNKLDIRVDYFCDSKEELYGKTYDGIEIISPKELKELSPDSHFFVSNSYIKSVTKTLKENNFQNIYNCVNLFENTDFSKKEFDTTNWDSEFQVDEKNWSIDRVIELHKISCKEEEIIETDFSKPLFLKHVDIVVTERCSLKCKDCSNLMQYYANPENVEIENIFESTDRLLQCVDSISELRVIGGDPFMNKEVHKVINKLVEYDKVKSVVVYTNAKIIPKNENLECLKNKKVITQITNYGPELSTKHDETINIFEKNNIGYISNRVTKWQDCGTLNFIEKTEEQLENMFINCCARDVLTLLHGKLYRCPFSANGVNLGAIPKNDKDLIDFLDNKIPIEQLINKLNNFYFNTNYTTACQYCNGRDYGSAEINAAIQVKKPIPF